MPSSTKIPITSIIPNREIIFMVIPAKLARINIAKNDDGSFYGDGILYMLKDGKLKIEGTAEDPVEIQGDRLESEFEFVPGQWGRIQLGPQSSGHIIDHAIIRNATIGLLVDSMAEVTIKNTEIANTTSSALAGYKANVRAENCLFHTSGANNVTIILGGNYNFTYCTLANFGTPSEALSAANFTCLDGTPLCEIPKVARLRMHFKNSIITGSSRDEIALFDAVGDQDPSFFQYSFENCIVKVDELLTEGGYSDFFRNCFELRMATFLGVAHLLRHTLLGKAFFNCGRVM